MIREPGRWLSEWCHCQHKYEDVSVNPQPSQKQITVNAALGIERGDVAGALELIG